MKGIAFSEMWKLYRASGMSSDSKNFSIGYRKLDGTWSEKKNVRRYSGSVQDPSVRKDHTAIAHEVKRSGIMKLEDEHGKIFEIKAFGVMEFNGLKVDHRF